MVPATAPIVLFTFGKLISVRTPSPPTAGPHEKGPAVKSINAHLEYTNISPHCVFHVCMCKQTAHVRDTEKEREIGPVFSNPGICKTVRMKIAQVPRL